MNPTTEDPAAQCEERGLALFGQGDYLGAVAQFEQLVRLRPDSARAHASLGVALGQAGHSAASLVSFERALVLDPAAVDVHLNVARLLTKMGRPLEAVRLFRQAQQQFPHHPEVHYTAGLAYYAQGLREEAAAAFEITLKNDRDHAPARWLQAITTLPQSYGPGEDPATFRLEFEAALRSLAQWFDETRVTRAPESVSERQPFYLAFMEEDNCPLLSDYGDLCVRLMRPFAPTHVARPQSSGPVRVAVVTAYLFDQSVWTALVRGWCTQMDRTKIEFHFFHTGTVHCVFRRS